MCVCRRREVDLYTRHKIEKFWWSWTRSMFRTNNAIVRSSLSLTSYAVENRRPPHRKKGAQIMFFKNHYFSSHSIFSSFARKFLPPSHTFQRIFGTITAYRRYWSSKWTIESFISWILPRWLTIDCPSPSSHPSADSNRQNIQKYKSFFPKMRKIFIRFLISLLLSYNNELHFLFSFVAK